MSRYVCGIDNGGTTVKCALFDLTGREVAVASEPTPLVTPRPDFEERDMDVLWAANARVIRRCLEKAGVSGREVIGVGCTGHGKGLYPVKKDGTPVRRAIASTDSRAVSYIKQWEADGTSDDVCKLTLHRPIACQPIALLAWLRDNEPEAYAAIGYIFEAKDYIRYKLTGTALAETTDYSGSGMMNVTTQQFDRAIFERIGIAEMFDCLPPLCSSAELCGRVTAEAARETGLCEGTPVSGGMFDIDACAIAAGVTDGADICMVTGTWSINEYVADAPVSHPTTMNSLYCIPGKYLIEESSATSAGNLEWVLSLCMDKTEGNVYAAVDALVEGLDPADCDVTFVPFLYGTNSPVRSRAVFDGLDMSAGRAHLLRAVYEGVAFSHYTHLLHLLENREAPDALRCVGGAARSAVWAQLFADVTGLPVRTVEAREPGALGAAMSAAVACGHFDSYEAAAAQMVVFGRTFMPDAARHAVYMEKYERYCRLI